MESKELMEKLFGEGALYVGMEVEWECFAGKGAYENGVYEGKITSITWCQHCHLPTVNVETKHGGAKFTVRISKGGKLVCGSEAPE